MVHIIWMFPKIVVRPNHPILIGFSIINHPFWGTPIFGNTHTDFEHCSPKPTTTRTEALPGAWDALAVVVTASTVRSLG